MASMKRPTVNAEQKAARVLPVLTYYASVVRKTLTYGDLAGITGDHHRAFKPAFALLHRWISESAKRRRLRELPLAIIVVQKGKTIPGAGAIRWRLRDNNLPLTVGQDVIDALFKEEQRKIFDFDNWQEILDDRGLKPYVPKKTDISTITEKLVGRYAGGEGESESHRKLKLFISTHPQSAHLPATCELINVEFTFPSLDRADVAFTIGDELFIVEVKSSEADQIEITRGIYQVVKYKALAIAVQKDRSIKPKVSACLALEGSMTNETRTRAGLLGVKVIESIKVPNNFKPE